MRARCEQLERSRAASLSLRGCAVRVRGAGAGASHELRPVWRRAAHEALQWHRAAPPAAAAAAAPPPFNATEPNATARPRITRAVVGWSGDALRHRMAAATRLRRRVRAHTELRQGVAEMACRQRVAHEIAEGTTHEVTSMFALSLTAGTEGFLKAIFDAVILPLVDILIYLLVLLLVILIGMGFIARMVAVLMWTMPLAMELTLGPVVSNMLCALLTFCLRITVSDGVSETITKLMDALLMGRVGAGDLDGRRPRDHPQDCRALDEAAHAAPPRGRSPPTSPTPSRTASPTRSPTPSSTSTTAR